MDGALLLDQRSTGLGQRSGCWPVLRHGRLPPLHLHRFGRFGLQRRGGSSRGLRRCQQRTANRGWPSDLALSGAFSGATEVRGVLEQRVLDRRVRHGQRHHLRTCQRRRCGGSWGQHSTGTRRSSARRPRFWSRSHQPAPRRFSSTREAAAAPHAAGVAALMLDAAGPLTPCRSVCGAGRHRDRHGRSGDGRLRRRV